MFSVCFFRKTEKLGSQVNDWFPGLSYTPAGAGETEVLKEFDVYIIAVLQT